ncbi:MAG: hypothetical protein EA392_14560 [Cryomorphaceae bacterium]|nr:MAG: hypothetical protein EA392_14560 [Cryomorphaceae bacterium]
MMLRRFFCIALILLVAESLTAQLYPYSWRLGVSAGYTTYYGDLNPFAINGLGDAGKVFRLYDFNPNYIPGASYNVSLEARLTPTMGIALKGGQYSFAMSDRFVNRAGNLQTDALNFERALNVKTNISDVGIALIFGTDNGWFLNRKASFAPYLGIGAGILWFDTYADLYDDNGLPYDYTQPDLMTNGVFETALRPLRTELNDEYSRQAWYAELSLGFRWRVAHRWEIFVQSDFKYASTDYLDDVSGRYRRNYVSPEQQLAANPTGLPEEGGFAYRGNNNGINDFYIYHGIGLRFNFRHRRDAFRAPTVTGRMLGDAYMPAPEKPDTRREAPAAKADDVATEVHSERTRSQVELEPEMEEELRSALVFLHQEIEDLNRAEESRRLMLLKDSLQEEISKLNDTIRIMVRDTVRIEENKEELAGYRTQQEMLNNRLDSLYRIHAALLEELTAPDTLPAPRRFEPAAPVAVASEPVKDTVRIKEPADRSMEDRWMARLEAQAKRDSVLMTRLMDLLEDRGAPAPRTVPSATEDPLAPRETDAEVSRAEMEALKLEMKFLQDEVARRTAATESGVTPQPGVRGTDVTVIPTPPVVIRDKTGEDRPPVVVMPGGVVSDTARTRQLEDQLATLRKEMELLRTDMRARDYLLNLDKLTEERRLRDTLHRLDMEHDEYDEMLERLRETTRRLETKKEETPTQPIPAEKEEPAPPAEPAVTLPPVSTFKVTVYFAINSTKVDENDVNKIRKAVDLSKHHPGHRFVVTGFADNTGNPDYNKIICQRRNEAVKNALINEFGISKERIETRIGGQIVRGSKRGSESEDRRVEITLRPPGE